MYNRQRQTVVHFCRAIVNKTFQPDALSTQCFEDFAVKKNVWLNLTFAKNFW